MKAIVLYMSLTGNTKKVAEAIREGIAEIAGSCDIQSITETDPKRFYRYDYDLIGIGTPTWGGPVPNVIHFIDDLIGVGGKHAFIFYTHGTIPWHVVPRTAPHLQAKGLTVIGWGNWHGDHPWPWALYPYPTGGHPDEIDLREAREFGRQMAEKSIKMSTGEDMSIPEVPEDWLEEGYPVQAIWDTLEYGAVKFDKSKCRYPKCKLCMEHCWSHSIDLSLDPPRVANPCCEHCVWCAMICPTGAMNIDEYLETQLPNYALLEKEHAFPNIDREDQPTELRWLVPQEEVGSQGHFADVYNRHPMWAIGKGPVKKRPERPPRGGGSHE